MINILGRLGEVCYWVCTALATMIFLFGMVGVLNEGPHIGIIIFPIAVLTYLAGCLVRYVLYKP